jgi:hypothetical protein
VCEASKAKRLIIASADGDPAADGYFPKTVDRCKQVHGTGCRTMLFKE